VDGGDETFPQSSCPIAAPPVPLVSHSPLPLVPPVPLCSCLSCTPQGRVHPCRLGPCVQGEAPTWTSLRSSGRPREGGPAGEEGEGEAVEGEGEGEVEEGEVEAAVETVEEALEEGKEEAAEVSAYTAQ